MQPALRPAASRLRGIPAEGETSAKSHTDGNDPSTKYDYDEKPAGFHPINNGRPARTTGHDVGHNDKMI